MLSTKKIILLSLVILWEISLSYCIAFCIEEPTEHYLLAARYSARTSFFILIGLLSWTGFKGLTNIYNKEQSRQNFVFAILCLAVNHLMHFYYLSMNFWVNNLNIFEITSLFGAIGYVSLSLAPFYLWNKKQLTTTLYWGILGFLFVITLIFFVTYLGRLFMEISIFNWYFFRVSLVVIVGLLGWNGYRISKEKSNN